CQGAALVIENFCHRGAAFEDVAGDDHRRAAGKHPDVAARAAANTRKPFHGEIAGARVGEFTAPYLALEGVEYRHDGFAPLHEPRAVAAHGGNLVLEETAPACIAVLHRQVQHVVHGVLFHGNHGASDTALREKHDQGGAEQQGEAHQQEDLAVARCQTHTGMEVTLC